MKPLCRPALRRATLPLLWLTAAHACALGHGSGLPTNIDPRLIAQNDALAWSLLGVLGLTMGMVAACGVGIFRQGRRHRQKQSLPEQHLLEEIKDQLRQLPPDAIAPTPKRPPAGQPWEKPADWWKNPPD